jgi:hypothetical protein
MRALHYILDRARSKGCLSQYRHDERWIGSKVAEHIYITLVFWRPLAFPGERGESDAYYI